MLPLTLVKTEGKEQEALQQMELDECLHHDNSLGGVEDYSDEFRAIMNLKGHTRCRTVLNAYQEVYFQSGTLWKLKIPLQPFMEKKKRCINNSLFNHCIFFYSFDI